MTHELVYTSALRGVRPGTTGYCTVAHTAGLPVDLQEQLEGLSRFRHRAVGADPDRSGSPISYAHTLLTVGYQTYHVLSRVADTGLDHTGRSNYLAHHIAFGPDKLLPAGPAWLCEQPRVFETAWDRPPEVLSAPRGLPRGSAGPRKCKRWERATGDAGWAGVLAAATTPAVPAYLVFKPGTDVLGLVAEAMALLPPEARWEVTFNTYFTGATAGSECQWRCVLADSPEAREAIASRRGVVLRLDRGTAGEPAGPLVEAARTGVAAASPRRPAPAAVGHDAASSARQPRYPRLTTESPPGEDEKAGEEPSAPTLPRTAGSGLRPLLVGLVLGVMLLMVCGSLVEVASGRSLLRHAGLKGEDEKETETRLAALEDDVLGAKKDAQAAKKDAQEKAGAYEVESKRMKLDSERWAAERTRLERDVRKANDERKAAEDALAAVTEGGEKQLLEKLKDAQRELEKVRGERDWLAGQVPRGGPTGPPPAVMGLNNVTLNKTETLRELFRTDTTGAKSVIEVFGRPDGTNVENKADGSGVSLLGPGEFRAEVTIGEGAVLVKGTNLDRHPLMGMAVIKVSSGEGNPPVFRQLFRPEARRDPLGMDKEPKGPDAGGSSLRYAVEPWGLLPVPLRKEVDELAKAKDPFRFGRTARILFNKHEYYLEDLNNTSAPGGWPTVLKSRQDKSNPHRLTLKFEKDQKGDCRKVILEVEKPPAVAPANCQILSLEIVRPIGDLQGYGQELLRVR